MESSIAAGFVYKLVELRVWSSVVRFTEYYAKLLTFPQIAELVGLNDIFVRVICHIVQYHAMVADAAYELCCDLLISQHSIHIE